MSFLKKLVAVSDRLSQFLSLADRHAPHATTAAEVVRAFEKYNLTLVQENTKRADLTDRLEKRLLVVNEAMSCTEIADQIDGLIREKTVAENTFREAHAQREALRIPKMVLEQDRNAGNSKLNDRFREWSIIEGTVGQFKLMDRTRERRQFKAAFDAKTLKEDEEFAQARKANPSGTRETVAGRDEFDDFCEMLLHCDETLNSAMKHPSDQNPGKIASEHLTALCAKEVEFSVDERGLHTLTLPNDIQLLAADARQFQNMLRAIAQKIDALKGMARMAELQILMNPLRQQAATLDRQILEMETKLRQLKDEIQAADAIIKRCTTQIDQLSVEKAKSDAALSKEKSELSEKLALLVSETSHPKVPVSKDLIRFGRTINFARLFPNQFFETPSDEMVVLRGQIGHPQLSEPVQPAATPSEVAALNLIANSPLPDELLVMDLNTEEHHSNTVWLKGNKAELGTAKTFNTTLGSDIEPSARFDTPVVLLFPAPADVLRIGLSRYWIVISTSARAVIKEAVRQQLLEFHDVDQEGDLALIQVEPFNLGKFFHTTIQTISYWGTRITAVLILIFAINVAYIQYQTGNNQQG